MDSDQPGFDVSSQAMVTPEEVEALADELFQCLVSAQNSFCLRHIVPGPSMGNARVALARVVIYKRLLVAALRAFDEQPLAAAWAMDLADCGEVVPADKDQVDGFLSTKARA